MTAAVDYLASLGEGEERRDRISAAMQAIDEHDSALTGRFLSGLAEMPAIRLYGIDDGRPRTPTFAVSVEGMRPEEVAEELGRQGIFVWAGHYYAVEVMRRIGVLDKGGLVRIGFVHYNTLEEVDRVVAALGICHRDGVPRRLRLRRLRLGLSDRGRMG